MNQITDFLAEQGKHPNVLTFLLFFFVLSLFAVLPIPGLVYFSVLISFFLKNPGLSFLIVCSSSSISGIVTFVFIRLFCKDYFLGQFGQSLTYRIFESEYYKSPWGMSVIANIMAVPACTKHILLPLTEMSFVIFLIPKLIFDIFFSLLYVMIGGQLDGISNLSSGKSKGFFE